MLMLVYFLFCGPQNISNNSLLLKSYIFIIHLIKSPLIMNLKCSGIPLR